MKALLGGVLICVSAAATPAAAQNYPWCAYYAMGGDGGGTNCGFTTYQQCMETLSGMGGFCNRNTQYVPPPGPRAKPAYRPLRRPYAER